MIFAISPKVLDGHRPQLTNREKSFQLPHDFASRKAGCAKIKAAVGKQLSLPAAQLEVDRRVDSLLGKPFCLKQHWWQGVSGCSELARAAAILLEGIPGSFPIGLVHWFRSR